MKLAIETCFLHDQYYRRGIGRYGREMVARILQHALYSNENIDIHLISFTNLIQVLDLLELNPADYQALANSTPRPGFNLHFHSLGEAKLSQPQINIPLYLTKIRPLVKQIKPDAYFAPHFERGLPSDLVPTFAVAHDAIPLITRQFSKQNKLINFLKGKFFQFMWDKLIDCEVVFTSSNVSKHDLVTFGKIPADQIEVVYLGISEVFLNSDRLTMKDVSSPLVQNVLTNPQPFIIYDAGFEANKNTAALAKIFAALKSELNMPNLKLVVTGGDFDPDTASPTNERSANFMKLAESVNIAADFLPVGRVSEEELALLVKNALAYMNMSDYEGFGFGPLQAMAVGTPAIISNNPCFVEVSGEAALIVSPKNTDEAATSAANLLSDEKIRQELVDRAKSYAHDFTWQKTFAQTWVRTQQTTSKN